MMLDFNAIPETVVPAFKGGTGEAVIHKFNDPGMGNIVHITLMPGCSIGVHTHQGNCEVVYIISGSGKCIDDGVATPVTAGCVNYCPEGHSHSILNTGTEPLVLFGVLPDCK